MDNNEEKKYVPNDVYRFRISFSDDLEITIPVDDGAFDKDDRRQIS